MPLYVGRSSLTSQRGFRDDRAARVGDRPPWESSATVAGAVLALQRAAGNRATAAAVRRARAAGAAAPRSLARCAGTCRCGGACKGDEEADDELGPRLLQAAAGRRAGAASRRVLARRPITSPRFTGEPLLQDCADDKARMGVGRQDDATHKPVSKVQRALLDWAAGRRPPITLDLGTTGPGGDGVDGVYGPKTAAAVRLFKQTETLGFEQFGDVGPGTMNRLNDLFPAVAPTPPTPPPTPPPRPPISPDDQKHKDAFDDRRKQLREVERKLGDMIGAVIRSALVRPGEGPVPTVTDSFPREVCVVQFFTGATPRDPDYLETLRRARELVHQDLTGPVQPLTFRSKTRGFCVERADHDNPFAATCSPNANCGEKGTQLCDPVWYDADRHCRSDVLIHETYHWLELPGDGKDFPGPGRRTPAAAFSNADTMTQLGNALIGLEIDNCVPTERKRTVFPDEMRTCLSAPPQP